MIAPNGVYFARRDYAGAGRRFVCGLIDLAMLGALWVALLTVFLLYVPRVPIAAPIVAAVWLSILFGYLIVLKRSRIKTLGYRLTGIKVVDLTGGRPSILCMTVRSGLVFMGTGFLMIDLLCVLLNADRQKISDVVAGTYVVRVGSAPQGGGKVVTVIHCVFTYFLAHREVRRTVPA